MDLTKEGIIELLFQKVEDNNIDVRLIIIKSE